MAKRILFIEDEPDQITLIKTRIEASGYGFDSANNGESGLEKVSTDKPDLVLLDVVLPGISGLEVCKRLKQDEKTKEIPIILLTAIGAKNAEEKCMACGADSFLKKPYDSAVLMKEIKKFIG